MLLKSNVLETNNTKYTIEHLRKAAGSRIAVMRSVADGTGGEVEKALRVEVPPVSMEFS